MPKTFAQSATEGLTDANPAAVLQSVLRDRVRTDSQTAEQALMLVRQMLTQGALYSDEIAAAKALVEQAAQLLSKSRCALWA